MTDPKNQHKNIQAYKPGLSYQTICFYTTAGHLIFTSVLLHKNFVLRTLLKILHENILFD